MARDLRINIDGNSGGGQKALEEAAAAAALAAREADRLGDQFKQAQRDAASLDRQLLETAVATRALAKELAKTPDDAGLKTQLDKQRKAASELKRLRQDIVGDTEAAAKSASRVAEDAARDVERLTAQAAREAEKLANVAAKNAEKIAKAAAKQAESLATIANPGEGFSFGPAGLGVAGVAAGPALAAAGGAALAGIGAAGAGAGVAAAVLGDPKAFKSAWDDAIGTVKKDFFDAGASFVGPTLDAIKTIGPTIDSWNLSAALAPAAKYVPVLVSGLERAATGLERGIADGIAHASLPVKALSDGLAQLGEAAGDALSNIADGAEGGAQALHDTLTAVSALVEGFGLITEGAEKAYGFVNDHPLVAAGFTAGLSIPASLLAKALGDVDQSGQGVGHTLSGVKTTIDATGHSVQLTADDFAALSKGIKATKESTDVLAGQMSDKLFTTLLGVDQATLSWHESLTSLAETLKQNGLSLDENTSKGQANVAAIYASVEANIRQYDANIAAGHSAVEAAAAYDANTAALEKQLRKAGLTQAQIDGLIGTYVKVPDSVDTSIKTYGLEDAINQLGDMLARLLHIDGYVAHAHVVVDDTYIGNRQSTYSQQVPRYKALGDIRHAAAGFIVGPSDPGTLIGEPQTGGEALIPLQGISQARAAMLAQTAVGGYGLDVVPRVPRGLFGSGGSAPQELVLHAVFLDPQTGETMRKQTIRWSLDHGRDPATATAA